MGKVQIHKRRETRDFERRDNWLVPRPEAPWSCAPKSKVKGLVLCLLVLLAIGLSACKDASSETTSSNKAAMELYCKYADNANLTVAYLGDLSVNGKCIDALMLQADNEMDWEMLKRDFGFMAYDTTDFNCPNGDNPVMVGVGIETDFLDDAVFDTLTDISQLPEEDIERFTHVVADKIREVMNSFQTPDSLLPNTAIVVGQGEIEHEGGGNTYDDYIMEVSRSVVIGMINDKIGAKNRAASADSVAQTSLQQQMDRNGNIMDNIQTHGHLGYITAANNDERTLWLFFYDDQEECNTIITHISEDMIINY